MKTLMPSLDRLSRVFWRTLGGPIDLSGAEQWLLAPMHDAETIGDSWLVAAGAADGGRVEETTSGGLLADMAGLSSRRPATGDPGLL